MRRFLLAVAALAAAVLALAALAAPPAAASPARRAAHSAHSMAQAASYGCTVSGSGPDQFVGRGTGDWAGLQSSGGYQWMRNDGSSDGDYGLQWCQNPSSFTYGPYTWFTLTDPATGQCLTVDATSSPANQVWELNCVSGAASQEWTFNGQTDCNGSFCYWLVGNGYLAEAHDSDALYDNGSGSDYGEYNYTGGNNFLIGVVPGLVSCGVTVYDLTDGISDNGDQFTGSSQYGYWEASPVNVFCQEGYSEDAELVNEGTDSCWDLDASTTGMHLATCSASFATWNFIYETDQGVVYWDMQNFYNNDCLEGLPEGDTGLMSYESCSSGLLLYMTVDGGVLTAA